MSNENFLTDRSNGGRESKVWDVHTLYFIYEKENLLTYLNR